MQIRLYRSIDHILYLIITVVILNANKQPHRGRIMDLRSPGTFM